MNILLSHFVAAPALQKISGDKHVAGARDTTMETPMETDVGKGPESNVAPKVTAPGNTSITYTDSLSIR